MMHAKEIKAKELEHVKGLIKKYNTITIADLTNLPSSTLQKLRKKLKDKVEIRITKKSLIMLAIDQIEDKNLSGLKPSLENSIPVLILSNEDPFKLYKSIKDNKSNAVAKPGQISPRDIIIPAGPTNFTPGPIIGELGAVGLQTGVEGGKITIKKEKLIVRENEVIKPEIASILSKLGIEPIEIGLNVIASFKDNIIYLKDILDIDEEAYIKNIILASNEALALAEKLGFVSKDNVRSLIRKAYMIASNLDKKFELGSYVPKAKKVEVKEEVKEAIEEEKENIVEEQKELKRENKEKNFVGFGEDTVKKAQDILQKLQDEKIKEQEKPKHKSMWD